MKYIVLLIIVSVVIVNSFAQKPNDYKILTQLIKEVNTDSSVSYFQCDLEVSDDLAKSIFRHYSKLVKSLELQEEFSNYLETDVKEKMHHWKWKKNKINYQYVVQNFEDSKECFSISPPIYSRSKKYFFVVFDYSTHTSSAIFELKEDNTIKILKDSGIRVITPKFS